MPDPIISNIDQNNVIVQHAVFNDGLLTSVGATTHLEGTILARDTITGSFVPFVVGGVTNGDGIPTAILTYDVIATGAGDTTIHAAVSGQYQKERLVIAADGDGSNVDVTIEDQLRDFGLVTRNVDQLNILDNQ